MCAIDEKVNNCSLAIEGSYTAIWDWVRQDSVISLSMNWWLFIGVDSKEEIISFSKWLNYIHNDDQIFIKEKLDKLLSTSSNRYMFEFRCVHSNGDIRWFSNKGQIVRNEKGDALRFVGLISDITQQKKISKKTDFMAYYDELTSLPNRINLKDRILQSINRVSRNSSYGFSLLFLDLDGFKHVNDSFGHATGDKILIMVSNRFKECVRSVDTVSRVGGDEFIILLDGITNPDEINIIADRIVQTASREFNIDNYSIFISVSIGIEAKIKKGSAVDDIIQNADRAMYHAKMRGKGQYYYFDHDSFIKEQHRWFLGNELHRALTNNEMVIYYQPIFNIVTGKIYSFEALLRWNHPERGLISPMEFIPVAEETGIITSLTEWVIKSTCEKIINLSKNEALGYKDLIFAINISAKDFMMVKDFSMVVKNILKESACLPVRFAIEVTEGAIIRSYENAIRQLKELRKMGIIIELDDFGTGYSSLSYLSSFPLDIIKIDKSFIDNMLSSDVSLKLIKSIINLAHDLGLKVVAEGIENSDQLNELYTMDCDYIQGFLYSRPIPSDDIENYLLNLPQKHM